MTEEKTGLEKLVPESKTITLNGHEIEVNPLKNEKVLQAAMEAEKRGKDNIDFFLELIADTLNDNDGFEDVTGEGVREGKGSILPLIQAVQEVNGLQDFLDEEEIQEIT